MSQAQPSSVPTLTNAQAFALKKLTVMGYLEGTSFLLLLGIAMPLKYMLGISEAVTYIGMAHGALFIAYILMLLLTASKIKLPLWAMPAGVLRLKGLVRTDAHAGLVELQFAGRHGALRAARAASSEAADTLVAIGLRGQLPAHELAQRLRAAAAVRQAA